MSKPETIQPLDDTVKKALEDVRAPAQGPAAFVVLTYSAANVLTVKGAGSGGLNEAMALFDDTEVSYALIRKDYKVEMANTVKFALVHWIPTALKPMRRALVSTHKGQVNAIFKPFHVDAEISDKSELSEEKLDKLIGNVSGTASAVCEKPADKPAAAPAAASEPAASGPIRPSPLPPQTKKTEVVSQKFVGGKVGGLAHEDEAAFSSLLKQVRSDKGDINWLLIRFGKVLSVVGSGNGGVDELVSKLEESNPCFGLVRVTELIDNKSKTTKFAYIRYVPRSTKPMLKGELSTKKGTLDTLFQPFHVDLTVETASEVSEAVVMDHITTASGSKSHVVHRD